MASQIEQQRLTADEFLRIIFEPDVKAELDNGIVRMMTGGNLAHARVHRNLIVWLAGALRGSGCRPFGPDMAVRTGKKSVRYPDVVVDCASGPQDDKSLELLDPRIIIEVLSPGTRSNDRGAKFREYRGLLGVDTIALVNPIAETVQVLQRREDGRWPDILRTEPGNLSLPAIGLAVPRSEIFARD